MLLTLKSTLVRHTSCFQTTASLYIEKIPRKWAITHFWKTKYLSVFMLNDIYRVYLSYWKSQHNGKIIFFIKNFNQLFSIRTFFFKYLKITQKYSICWGLPSGFSNIHYYHINLLSQFAISAMARPCACSRHELFYFGLRDSRRVYLPTTLHV